MAALDLLAREFVASEVGLRYWSVWWEALIVRPELAGLDGAALRCEVVGVADVDAAVRAVKDIAGTLGVRLPDLRTVGRRV